MTIINRFDAEYFRLARKITSLGVTKSDRTGSGTISHFGLHGVYDMSDGAFPILSTKYVHFPSVLHELLWFISGETNIKYLVENGVSIWNKDAVRWANELGLSETRFGRKLDVHSASDRKEFVELVKCDDGFVFDCRWKYLYGDLGNVYGKQWMRYGYNGFNQLQRVIDEIRSNPASRRLVVSAWNPDDMWNSENVALPCCHILFQFNVNGEYLDIQFYMRSNDFLLGHPFNVSSYAALLAMVAKITGYKPGKVVYSCGDAHIYKPHIEPLEIQMNRPHHEYTRLVIKDRGQKEITDFVYDDFELVGYDELNSGKLKAEMFT